MENRSSRASKVLKILHNISSVSGNAMISRWNKAHGLEPTENPSHVDVDELIELVLLELKEPINESDDEK